MEELAGDAAKGIGSADVMLEAGFRVGVFGTAGEQELAEVCGGDLKAHGRQLKSVVVIEDVEDAFFADAVGVKAFLVEEPILIAALVPVGDVASGDAVAELGKRGGDVVVRDAVLEHTVNEVAFEFGEGGDFAITATTG